MTTQPAAPVTLDVLIEYMVNNGYDGTEEQAILASLRKLKRIEDMKGLPEPVAIGMGCAAMANDGKCQPVVWFGSYPPDGAAIYGPEVLDLLAAQEVQMNAVRYARDLAESKLAKVMEALREPSEEMWDAVWKGIKVKPLDRARKVLSIHEIRLMWAAFHKAMSAVAIKEGE